MKRGIVFLTVIAIGTASAHAGTYESGFGFTVDLPSHWHVMNRESLKGNPSQTGSLQGIDKNVLKKNKPAIADGKAELYYDDLYDLIYVQRDRGGMKPYKTLEKHICNKKLLQKTLSKSFGRPVHIYACRVVRVSNYDAVYMDFDGAQPGTRSLQYQIWKPANDTVILTLTARNKNLPKLRDEFTAMIYSLAFIR